MDIGQIKVRCQGVNVLHGGKKLFYVRFEKDDTASYFTDRLFTNWCLLHF